MSLAVALFMAGCAAQRVQEPIAAPVAAAVPIATVLPAPPRPVSEYRYRLLSPDTTGTEQVFDDGQRTYVTFRDRPPARVLFFQEDGQPLRATVVDRFAIIEGVHDGVLIRGTTQYSYAAPRDPLRVKRAQVGQAPTATDFDLPADLAALRALILASEARSEDPTGARVASRRTMANLKAVNRQLDEVQTKVEGMPARMVRLHFASGRSDISL